MNKLEKIAEKLNKAADSYAIDDILKKQSLDLCVAYFFSETRVSIHTKSGYEEVICPRWFIYSKAAKAWCASEYQPPFYTATLFREKNKQIGTNVPCAKFIALGENLQEFNAIVFELPKKTVPNTEAARRYMMLYNIIEGYADPEDLIKR